MNRTDASALPDTSLPRQLPLSDALLPLERAVGAASILQARLETVPFQDNMLRIEARLDVLALMGEAPASDTLLRLLVAEAGDERPIPRDLRRAVQALDAMRHGLDVARARGRAGLTIGLLDEMHRLMLGGVVTQEAPGPTGPVDWPTDMAAHSRHRDEILDGMQDLERFLTDPPALPLPVRLAMMAGRIMLLASFEEDSLPLALLLLPVVAAAEGRLPLPAGSAMVLHGDTFVAALDALRLTGCWEAWICVFLSGLADAAEATAVRLTLIQRAGVEREAALVSLRSDSTARRLAQLVLGAPVLTVGGAQEMLGVSFQTANAAVATLVRLGILAPHSSSRRNRIFIVNATPLFPLVAR